MVRPRCPRDDMAQDTRSLCDLGVRDHASADSRGYGRGLLRRLYAALSRRSNIGERERGGGGRGVEWARLLPASPSASSRCTLCCRGARGEVPGEGKELQKVPGIGRYTAGAVASIAFDRPVALVDGNVARVSSRLRAIEKVAEQDAKDEGHWSFVQAVLEAGSPRVLSQALMELGATVCTPANPTCGECPLQARCEAFARGLQKEIPAPKKRKASPETHYWGGRNAMGRADLTRAPSHRRFARWDVVFAPGLKTLRALRRARSPPPSLLTHSAFSFERRRAPESGEARIYPSHLARATLDGRCVEAAENSGTLRRARVRMDSERRASTGRNPPADREVVGEGRLLTAKAS